MNSYKSNLVQGNKVISENFVDECIFRGRLFSFISTPTIGAEETVSFVFDATASLKKFIVLPLFLKSRQAVLELKIYEGTDYTGDTDISSQFKNRNRIMGNGKDFTLEAGTVTGTILGDLVIRHKVFGSASGFRGLTIGSDVGGSVLPFILDASKKYLITIENLDTSNSTQTEIQANIIQRDC